jgi:hypothetical protein
LLLPISSEIGHNFNLAHSGGLDKNTYSDHTCLMGNPYYDDDTGQMCFNAAKTWQIGWYNDSRLSIKPKDGLWSGTIIGVADYGNNPSNHPVVIRIETDTFTDQFITFNRAAGINIETKEAKNEVTIVETGNNGEWYSQSFLMATLEQGQSYTYMNWANTGENLVVDVQTINISAGTGYATVKVCLQKDCNGVSTPAPTPSPTRQPVIAPTPYPTRKPTIAPTPYPTRTPTIAPTPAPTRQPVIAPTPAPTRQPVIAPTPYPTRQPVIAPTPYPTRKPTIAPTPYPTRQPTPVPTPYPTRQPTPVPTPYPTPGGGSSCTDTISFFTITKPNGDVKRNAKCRWVARKHTQYRCVEFTGAKENCPDTCTNCCQNSIRNFQLVTGGAPSGPYRSCDWVSRNTANRCGRIPAAIKCPQICGLC